MLTNLLIENVAVIEKMEIEFGAGFNCITGETAAGKSIIIDAINLILGNRASRDIIRTGATKSIVQAIFYDNSEQLILYREIHLDGRNVCKVNGEFVTVAQLKERAENLVNIHGQHDNQSLLNPAKHIEILDEFAQNDIENNEYVIAKHEFDAVSKQIIDLEENESNKLQRLDMLKFQLNEIELVNPQLGEDAALENQKNTVKNLDAILSALHSAYNSLYEKENSILDELAGIHKAFLNLSDENANSVQNIKNEISELAHGINSQIEACESGGQSLEEIESRIYAIFSLKRKYGSEIADILNYKNEIATEIHNLENSEN
ncbi:MAG: AAA family ATPase, partial [Oscillospiraceae bacterium]|nr:AAA family ATPase [Oscillospiraceae bacterium]